MSEATIRRTREPAMRQRRFASPTRDSRRHSLPTKHGHADRPQATRGYQSDRSSDHDPLIDPPPPRKHHLATFTARPCDLDGYRTGALDEEALHISRLLKYAA